MLKKYSSVLAIVSMGIITLLLMIPLEAKATGNISISPISGKAGSKIDVTVQLEDTFMTVDVFFDTNNNGNWDEGEPGDSVYSMVHKNTENQPVCACRNRSWNVQHYCTNVRRQGGLWIELYLYSQVYSSKIGYALIQETKYLRPISYVQPILPVSFLIVNFCTQSFRLWCGRPYWYLNASMGLRRDTCQAG